MPHNTTRLITYAIVIISMMLSGCGGSKTTTETKGPQTETLAQAEARFSPSDYTRDPRLVIEADTRGALEKTTDIVAPKIALDTTRGYRVQVMFTAEIEQAGSLRDSLNSAFPGQWVYIVYDAPYYKVRIGNFAEHSDATEVLRSVVRQGYQDAWVVPDNVILHLPPRPATVAVPDSTAAQENR